MKIRADQIQPAVELLQNLVLFRGCPEPVLLKVAAELESRVVASGRVIMMDQEINRTLYILVKGEVGIYKRMGNERRQLALMKAPNFFGERSTLEDAPASAFVKAESECTLYTLERRAFDLLSIDWPILNETVQKNIVAVREERHLQTPPPPPAS